MMAVETLIYDFSLIQATIELSILFQTVIADLICVAGNHISFRRNLFQISCYFICKSYQTAIEQSQERTGVFSDCVMKSYNFTA